MESEQPTSSLKEIFANNRGLATVAILLGVGFVLMFVIVLVLLLRDDNLAIGATPTPFAESGDLGDGGESIVVGVSDTETISVTLDFPETLHIRDHAFSVRSQTILADRVWSPTFEDEDTAVWVYGTVINYVIGLSDTEENRTLLEQMAPGDRMMFTTRNGVQYAFVLNSRDQVLVGNPDVYAQQTPGLTLILIGTGGEERLVVNGRYVVDNFGVAGQNQGQIFELGETAQLEDTQLTVTGAVYLLDRPEAQPGFAFYLVDYQIKNVGLTALDTSLLKLSLLDESGNQYALNTAAAQLGNYPVLGGFLNASQTAQATAGYQIPIGLNSTTVNWIVSREDTGGQLHVAIPFSGGARAAQNAQVSLLQATISPDLSSILLNGQITNLGDQPIVISEADVSLGTVDGSDYLLLSTNPAFPWTVPTGQGLQYSVTFQRPIAVDNAVFTVLNQPFQLNNLR